MGTGAPVPCASHWGTLAPSRLEHVTKESALMPAASSHVTDIHVTGIHAAQRPASTTLRPLAGVFETLAEQHRQILYLLRRASSTRGRAKRRELWTQARRQLLSHERAEEQAVYAA